MLSARLRERIAATGVSQSELARRVGITQGTIAGLISGRSRSSSHLHKIARELQTTPAYLTGETDDADANAPPPPPAPTVQFVTMQVALPPERALAQMFVALLRMMPDDASEDERALLLARRLPIALSQLRDLLPDSPVVIAPAPDVPVAPATPVPEPQS
jgi:transcriptional regulator with XRE-family HTH domain